jgi:hypothetical protein
MVRKACVRQRRRGTFKCCLVDGTSFGHLTLRFSTPTLHPVFDILCLVYTYSTSSPDPLTSIFERDPLTREISPLRDPSTLNLPLRYTHRHLSSTTSYAGLSSTLPIANLGISAIHSVPIVHIHQSPCPPTHAHTRTAASLPRIQPR